MDTQASNKTNCNGNCQACSVQQRMYCASFMARANFDMMGVLINKIDTLQERINAMQSDGNLISPLKTEIEDQVIEVSTKSTIGASGADNRLLK